MKALRVLLLAGAFSVLTSKATHAGEIIHGRQAERNSVPYMASVQWNGAHICGGFLINPSFVLTAAHCHMHGLSVVLGTQNIDPNTENLRRYEVQSCHIHPTYMQPIYGFDIMLLKLSEEVSPNNHNVKMVQIPRKHQLVKPNTKCQVAGWGRTEVKPQVNDLRVASVLIVNITDCKKEWEKRDIRLPTKILCAGGYKTKRGACQGDSGGPLVCNNLAVGIVSFNYRHNCNYPNFPNVYTDISAYTEWINQVIKENA